MTRGHVILRRALSCWSQTDEVVCDYAVLHDTLPNGSEAQLYLLSSLERYIMATRVEILDARWGGISQATPADAREVEVGPETMSKLNGIIGFYGVNRAFLFLYLHAHLLSLGGEFEALDELNKMIKELNPDGVQ